LKLDSLTSAKCLSLAWAWTKFTNNVWV